MRRRISREERAAILEKFAQSGMTQQAFADSEGLNLGTFRGWIYSSRRSRPDESVDELRFVEVKLPSPGSDVVSISLGSTVRIELRELPSVEYLCSLARAFEQC